MPQKVHFISGLARSGSTLLSAILRPNPRFHSVMTSPVGGESRSNIGSDESISRVLRVYFP
ncbi:hypothetical protein [Microcoleus sp. AR_TQ3_B6]|uniref:hypothetical protein n=1 Tax=Microcoleus sp. AR_TQ3_B6 TaxID=3055284 RepID=UPI002FD4E6CB